jgi:hypothetical protein
VIAAELMPSQYSFEADRPFYQNITGFHRLSNLHPVDIVDPVSIHPPFFDTLPNINNTLYNSTLATISAGTIPWSSLSKAGFNMKERPSEGNVTGYNWVKGSLTLSTEEKDEVDYQFFGIHQIASGKIGFWGLPDGMRIDIRNMVSAWSDEEDKVIVREIIKGELEKELRKQRDNLMMSDVTPDSTSHG